MQVLESSEIFDLDTHIKKKQKEYYMINEKNIITKAIEYLNNEDYENCLKQYSLFQENYKDIAYVVDINKMIINKKIYNKHKKHITNNLINPIVSVIVPIYNNFKYLNECINSIRKQTLRNIEIICINDGSTDERVKSFLNNIKQKDDRIIVIHKNNTGYGHSMNIGLSVSKGEYIGIVESDDYIKPDMYASLVNMAKQFNVKIIKSNPVEFYDYNEHRNFKPIKLSHNKENYNKILIPSKDWWIFRSPILNQTGIFEKKFIVQNNIKFNETPGASFQDNGFYFQTMSLIDKIVFIDKEYYMLRRDNPNSSVKSKEKVFCSPEEFKFIKKFLLKNNQLKTAFIQSYNLRKFISYNFNYNRISEEFKPMFYERWKAEFKDAFKNNEINLKYFTYNERTFLKKLVGKEYYKRCQPKVSIIMPVYNDENYLEQSISSALNQNLNDIELICIDDGSTDSSINIIRKWAQKDSRVRYKHQKNQGSGIARNTGIKMALGQYILFLDADDYYPSNEVISTLVNLCEDNNVQIAGGVLTFDKEGKITKSNNKQDNFEKTGILKYIDWQFDYGFYRYIYKTDFIYDNKIEFPNLIRFQDPIFFINAMSKAKKFYASNINSYCYRWDPNRVEWNEHQIHDLIVGLNEVLIFSKNNNLTKLHAKTVNRIKTDFFKRITNAIKKYPNIKNLLNSVQTNIDYSLLPDNDKSFNIKKYYSLQ